MSTLSLTIRPEFFRLPNRGVDPHFGLSRAFYYKLDATGQVLLVRIRKRGTQRGVTLVNYEAMSRFLAKTVNQSSSDLAEQTESRPIPATPPAGNVLRSERSRSPHRPRRTRPPLRGSHASLSPNRPIARRRTHPAERLDAPETTRAETRSDSRDRSAPRHQRRIRCVNSPHAAVRNDRRAKFRVWGERRNSSRRVAVGR